MNVAIYFHPKASNLERLFSLGLLTKPANTWVIPGAVSERGSHEAPQRAGPSGPAGCACGELASWSGWKASRGPGTFVSAELKESPLRRLLHSHSLIPACLGSSLTCYNGLPVPLPVGPDADKFLPQERRNICVAVHENSDRIFQGNGSQIFHLQKQVKKKKPTWFLVKGLTNSHSTSCLGMFLSSLSYLLSHCGREKHCLTVVGTQPDYFLHLFLKVFIQHPTQENKEQLHLGLAKKHYLRQDNKDSLTAWRNESRKLPCFSLLSCLPYLSASSKISTSTLLRWKEGQLWRWSISRPGVAIRMSGPERRAASWVFTSRPPEREGMQTADPQSTLQQSTGMQTAWGLGSTSDKTTSKTRNIFFLRNR